MNNDLVPQWNWLYLIMLNIMCELQLKLEVTIEHQNIINLCYCCLSHSAKEDCIIKLQWSIGYWLDFIPVKTTNLIKNIQLP